MTIPDYIILIPIVAGIVLFLIPEKIRPLKAAVALTISGIVLYFSGILFFSQPVVEDIGLLTPVSENASWLTNLISSLNKYLILRIDSLSKLIVLFIGFFSFIIVLYSLIYIKKEKKYLNYYAYILLTLGASNGVALADNLILFVTLWGFLGLTLYKLIKSDNEESSAAAMKTLILIGGADALMIFGIGVIWKINANLNISELKILTSTPLGLIAFLSLLTGSFTKAGAFPFHTWIPDYTKNAPASSSAYLPASLDKLIGIYFLARLCNEMFILTQWLTLVIIIIGVSTIIIGVMMALIQHNYKKLLGYHAVSQVGYMVTGLGLGSMLGIIGGLFHMINNALYKSGLFLTAGNVNEQTGKDKLEDLGGLSGSMPITFIAGLIFALSISGVPPFNGFASKWIIYQGIIEFGREAGLANSLWIVWLTLAVIGSALTLASFIKFISGIFLGRRKPEFSKVKESNVLMVIPLIVIALLCVGFGVFATKQVVPYLFGSIAGEAAYIGSWNSSLVSLLVIVSIILGMIIYALGNLKNFRRDNSFIGGEKIQELTGFNVTEFYNTISDFALFSFFFQRAKKRWFDIYNVSREVVVWFNSLLSKAHNGILLRYTTWMIIGLIIMLIFFNLI